MLSSYFNNSESSSKIGCNYITTLIFKERKNFRSQEIKLEKYSFEINFLPGKRNSKRLTA